MKHFLISMLSTITLLLLFFHPILSTTTTSDYVLDLDNEPLVPSQSYYMVPYATKYEGGFTWSLKKELSLCPHFYVKLQNEDFDLGNPYPTSFFPQNSKQDKIALSSNLNIMFNDISLPRPFFCFPTSSYWQLEADDTTGMLFVTLGGSHGKRYDEESWFKIEENHEVKGTYKIRYCPSENKNNNGGVTFFGDILCGDLGVVYMNGERWLGMNDTSPLAVVFDKHALVNKA